MMVSFDALIRYVTADQIFDALLSNLERVRIPARSWRKGGVARSVLGGIAEVGFQGATIATSCIRGMFLLLGSGGLLVLGAGKASARMARAVEDILGARISQGLVSVKYGHAEPLSRVKVIEGGHPTPDEKGELAARRMAELVRAAD